MKEINEFGLYTDGRNTFIDDGHGSFLNCSCDGFTTLPSFLSELPPTFRFIMSIGSDMAFPENPMINRVSSGKTPVSLREIVEDLNNG